jgi:ligand-binding SRPBCC domain-containing protein
MINYLHREQIISATLETVWAYFADPNNLNALTPLYMNFEIISGGDVKMYEGQIIEYRVEFVRGIRSLWLTEIAHVRDAEYFVDEQRLGPYRFWYHEHKFMPLPEGVKMIDNITYAAPFGMLGDFVNAMWIRRKLNGIFEYRFHKIIEIFGDKK